MASISLVLRTNKRKKDGTCPIAIRIIQDRKTRFMFVGQYILESEWDDKNKKVKKAHPNSVRLNHLLAKKLSEANDKLLEAETSDQLISAEKLKQKIIRTHTGTSFFAAAEERIKHKYAAKVFSVARAERSILYNIQEFITMTEKTTKTDIMQRRKQRISNGRKKDHNFLDNLNRLTTSTSLSFEEINGLFLHDFKLFCSIYLDQKTRTITNQLIFIRTLFNVAISRGAVQEKFYPFAGEGEKIKISNGHKIGLTKAEIERIEALSPEPHSQMWHTRNVFLFSFYFAGIRISDVLQLQWSDFKDGRLYYTMLKNEKAISLKVPDKAAHILMQYQPEQQHASDFVFPFLKHANLKNAEDLFVKCRNATSLLNKYLARIAKQCDIDKTLSNHIARHSFGNIAKGSIDPYVLQKLYRHSDLKTTINYQANFIHKEADDALDNVVG